MFIGAMITMAIYGITTLQVQGLQLFDDMCLTHSLGLLLLHDIPSRCKTSQTTGQWFFSPFT